MEWISLYVATALIGGLAGLIFFFDGWRRNPRETLPFHKTPRITGLVWVVGGGVISGLLTYVAKADQLKALTVYIVWFCLMVFAALFLAGLAMATYYVLQHKRASLRATVAEAILFTLFFIANGLDATLERLSEAEQKGIDAKFAALERSRLYVLQFINDANAFLNDDVRSRRKGRNQFRLFLATHLRAFVLMFFEEKEILERYRAGFFERIGDNLVYVEGADLQGSGLEFTGQPLSLRGSLAGLAFRENRIVCFPEDGSEGYQTRSAASPYKSFIVVPVPFKPDSPEADRIGILVVDSLDADAALKSPLQRRLLIYFGSIIAGAQSVYLRES